MSIYKYGIYVYGLYITDDDLVDYKVKNNKDIADIAVEANLFEFNEAEGEAKSIITDNKFYVNESFYIGSIKKYPTLFSQAYKNKEDALIELKESYSKYLPENFDYDNKFVEYIGTIYC
jgi:hypothetical protein